MTLLSRCKIQLLWDKYANNIKRKGAFLQLVFFPFFCNWPKLNQVNTDQHSLPKSNPQHLMILVATTHFSPPMQYRICYPPPIQLPPSPNAPLSCPPSIQKCYLTSGMPTFHSLPPPAPPGVDLPAPASTGTGSGTGSSVHIIVVVLPALELAQTCFTACLWPLRASTKGRAGQITFRIRLPCLHYIFLNYNTKCFSITSKIGFFIWVWFGFFVHACFVVVFEVACNEK